MKEAEKANELRHALEDENQRLTDEVNEKIGNLEDVQERVADAEDELQSLSQNTRRQRRISRTPTRSKRSARTSMQTARGHGRRYRTRGMPARTAHVALWTWWPNGTNRRTTRTSITKPYVRLIAFRAVPRHNRFIYERFCAR